MMCFLPRTGWSSRPGPKATRFLRWDVTSTHGAGTWGGRWHLTPLPGKMLFSYAPSLWQSPLSKQFSCLVSCRVPDEPPT